MANLSLTVISGTSSTRVSRDVLDLMEAIIEVERRLLIAGLALSVQVAGRSLLYTVAADVLVILLIFAEEANFVFRSKPNYHEI